MYANVIFRLHEKKMKQKELAEFLGVHNTLLSKYLNGYREIPQHVRGEISKLLERDEAWLFEKHH
jgi:transcriptional regulator with XRE-family HTH domain